MVGHLQETIMEPPTGFCSSLSQFARFLPFFIGLLFLGTIKGIIFCPLICLIMTIGNTAVILGLWPAHVIWTYYSLLRAKLLGPVLKLVLCPCIFAVLIIWPVVGIVASITGGFAYGFLSPVFATFDAVREGNTDVFFHCLADGTWSSVTGSFTVVRDFKDVCFHSYFAYMDDLQRVPPDETYYEIRVLYLPGALIAGILGILLDVPVVSVIALFKSPYMLFKGWKRLLQDLIGREGPFLETICVPFAGLAILLWPLAVVGSVLGSMVASVFLGAYAGVVAYQESSLWLGLRYVIAALAIFDEYSNDVLDMPEGSCFPRPSYRNNSGSPRTLSLAPSFSRSNSFRAPPTQNPSIRGSIPELKTLELLESFFKEFQHYAETMVAEGHIILKDVEDAKSGKDEDGVVSIGLPGYCILQALLRSAKTNSPGILLSDNVTEITITNRPKEKFYDWFLNPLMIIKEQIKAQNLSADEEEYLSKSVLLNGNSERFKNSFTGKTPESEVKKAELDALSRRLRGITKSISRYPTYRRRYEVVVKSLLEELAKKNGGSHSGDGNGTASRSKRSLVRRWSDRSFNRKTSNTASESEKDWNHLRGNEPDIEIQ